MLNKILIYVIIFMLVSGGATIGTLYLKVKSQGETIELKDQQLADKDAELEVIGVNINNTLAKEDNDAKNHTIDMDKSIRTGIRRVR